MIENILKAKCVLQKLKEKECHIFITTMTAASGDRFLLDNNSKKQVFFPLPASLTLGDVTSSYLFLLFFSPPLVDAPSEIKSWHCFICEPRVLFVAFPAALSLCDCVCHGPKAETAAAASSCNFLFSLHA